MTKSGLAMNAPDNAFTPIFGRGPRVQNNDEDNQTNSQRL
jgi:hypothetical protein